MIVLSYDGSNGARAAIDLAAKTMPGTDATVVTVWEPFLEMVERSGALAGDWLVPPSGEDFTRLDEASERAAQTTAAEGVERARAAGLRAEARVVSRSGEIGAAILAEAVDVDAGIIFVGTRGRGDVRSFLLGSVSHYLLHHADRAVNVVPSPEIIDQRRHLGHEGAAAHASR